MYANSLVFFRNRFLLTIASLFAMVSSVTAQNRKEISFDTLEIKNLDRRDETLLGKLAIYSSNTKQKLLPGFYKGDHTSTGESILIQINNNVNLQDTFYAYRHTRNGFVNSTVMVLDDGICLHIKYYDRAGVLNKEDHIADRSILHYSRANKNFIRSVERVLITTNFEAGVLTDSLIKFDGKIPSVKRFYPDRKLKSDEVGYFYVKEYDSNGKLKHHKVYDYSKVMHFDSTFKNGILFETTVSKGTYELDTFGTPRVSGYGPGVYYVDASKRPKKVPAISREITCRYFPNGKISYKKIRENRELVRESSYNEKGIMYENKVYDYPIPSVQVSGPSDE